MLIFLCVRNVSLYRHACVCVCLCVCACLCVRMCTHVHVYPWEATVHTRRWACRSCGFSRRSPMPHWGLRDRLNVCSAHLVLCNSLWTFSGHSTLQRCKFTAYETHTLPDSLRTQFFTTIIYKLENKPQSSNSGTKSSQQNCGQPVTQYSPWRALFILFGTVRTALNLTTYSIRKYQTNYHL